MAGDKRVVMTATTDTQDHAGDEVPDNNQPKDEASMWQSANLLLDLIEEKVERRLRSVSELLTKKD